MKMLPFFLFFLLSEIIMEECFFSSVYIKGLICLLVLKNSSFLLWVIYGCPSIYTDV